MAPYDFTLKHRAGRVHNNADGLSRARAAPSPDTPPADIVALDSVWVHEPAAFEEALAVFEADPHLDGDADVPLPDAALPATTQGPRQLLLEAAPCSSCHTHFTPHAASVICDRCNAPYHVRCAGLHRTPATYWYCKLCTTHIHARGYKCPTEDIPL